VHAALRGRRPPARWLARLVGPEVGWQPEPDHDANAALRRSSLRRWLRELEAAGLVRVAIVVDELGQERGQDIELLPPRSSAVRVDDDTPTPARPGGATGPAPRTNSPRMAGR
jgi:hypothetical protein